MKEVIFILLISFFTLFEYTTCLSKARFEKVVFEKAENLVTHIVIHIRYLSFLTHLQQFLPPFLCGFA